VVYQLLRSETLSAVTTPQDTVSYTYDAAGRRLTMQAASQTQVSYTSWADAGSMG
jgi:YD repeat-containing protein